MKTKKLIIGLILLFSMQSFSQSNSSYKPFSWTDTSMEKELVYKTVEGHDIKANIFLPNTNGLHPVVIFFHGGGFVFGNNN